MKQDLAKLNELGLLMNFNVELVTTGIKRRLNPSPASRFLIAESPDSAKSAGYDDWPPDSH